MEIPPAKRPQPDQQMCPRCNQIVSYKTCRTHRTLYYKIDTIAWFKVAGYHVESSETRESHMNEEIIHHLFERL